MQKFKDRGSVIGAAACLIVLIGLFAALMRPVAYAGAAEDYHKWRQMDERWGNVDINGTTLARSGCLVTSLSIMLRHSDSIDAAALKNMNISNVDQFNPGVLANAYSARNGFNYYGGIASWGTISQIAPLVTFNRDAYLKSTSKADIAAEIKSMLDQGFHIILNVNGHHWVYVEGVVNGEVYMIDPASDNPLMFSEYQISGNNEYWALKCKNPPKYTGALTTTTTTTTVSTTAALNEYICTVEDTEMVYSSEDCTGTPVAELKNGYSVTIGKQSEDCGAVMMSDGTVTGWVKMKVLAPAPKNEDVKPGDINNDGKVDMYDLAVLNEWLSESLPSGISSLSSSEVSAADINGDGVTDENDVLFYLMTICD